MMATPSCSYHTYATRLGEGSVLVLLSVSQRPMLAAAKANNLSTRQHRGVVKPM